MWGWIIITGSMILSLSACGSSRPVPVAQERAMLTAKQAVAPLSPIQQLRLQAEKGNVEAQFALAQAYDRGRDVPRDIFQTVHWYQRAAEQGDSFSQFLLGNNYWEGTGIIKNEKEAVKWWRTAAAQGFAPAQNSLGKALATGSQSVLPDKTQAYVWLTLSAQQGDQEAEQQRMALAKQLKPDQLANAKQLIKIWKPAKPRALVNRIAP